VPHRLLRVPVVLPNGRIDFLDHSAHSLIHSKHNRLPGGHSEYTRRDTLVERSHTFYPPHIPCNGSNALERGSAWHRSGLLKACIMEESVSWWIYASVGDLYTHGS